MACRGPTITRVLAARRAEATCPVEELRHLGPELEPDQVLLAVDEVLARRPEAGHFLELCTARIMTEHGFRYLSGVGAAFLQRLQVAVLLCLGPLRSLLLIADGAGSLRSFFTDTLTALADKTMLLDWYHLKQKCLELSSRICRSKTAKAHFLRRLYRRLWRGDVPAAIAVLEAERWETKNAAKLDELIAYLQARAAWMVNYRQRRIEQKYIGSAHVEKANDLIVARRQKNRGMHWSEATSDALAGLRTLMLNGGWDRYWQIRSVYPSGHAPVVRAQIGAVGQHDAVLRWIVHQEPLAGLLHRQRHRPHPVRHPLQLGVVRQHDCNGYECRSSQPLTPGKGPPGLQSLLDSGEK